MVSPVSRWPVHWQCLLPAADHSRSHNHPPGPPGSFLTPATCRGGPSAAASDPPFNPAPILNPVDVSQLPPRRFSQRPQETQQQYWKQYGAGGEEENHLGQRWVESGSALAGEAPAAETSPHQTSIKHGAIFLRPAGGAAATNCCGLRSRAAATFITNVSGCMWIRHSVSALNGCVSVLNT